MIASLEVVVLPVSDPDKSLDFYANELGFALDVDYWPTKDFRVLQLTPKRSSTSIQFGIGLTDSPPGSVHNGGGAFASAPIRTGPTTRASPTSPIPTAMPGSFRSTLGQAVLRMTADVHRVRIGDDDLAALSAAMQTMPAHPDVAEGLRRLGEQGYRLVTLTNSPPVENGRTPLENAGIAEYIQRQFSVDTSRIYKPSSPLYKGVAEELGVPPSECMMVAAHVWDIIGAQAAGFSGALVTRAGNAPLPARGVLPPTLVVADLIELADRL
jgi:2-haloacid dehalogenase